MNVGQIVALSFHFGSSPRTVGGSSVDVLTLRLDFRRQGRAKTMMGEMKTPRRLGAVEGGGIIFPP
jgi:hypothetical protein